MKEMFNDKWIISENAAENLRAKPVTVREWIRQWEGHFC